MPAEPDFIEIGTDGRETTRAFVEGEMGWSREEMEGAGDRRVGMQEERRPDMVPYFSIATCTDPRGVRFSLHEE